MPQTTQKKCSRICVNYKVPLYYYGDKETLGAAIGRQYRASLALTDEGFAEAVTKEIEKMKIEN